MGKKILLLGALLLLGTTAMASGYVSTEFQARERGGKNVILENYQRLETFVHKNTENGYINLRIRDMYDNGNNFRVRLGEKVTDNTTLRYQYYTSGVKASHTGTAMYKSPMLNSIKGLSHTAVVSVSFTEGASHRTNLDSWTYYTLEQDFIPSFTINNETYAGDIANTDTLYMDSWIHARVWEYTTDSGVKFSVDGRIYDWGKVVEDEGYKTSHGVRVYARAEKKINVLGNEVETRLQVTADHNIITEQNWTEIAVKGTYRF